MDNLIAQWKREENMDFSGWDFSYLKGRAIDEKPPWDYKALARERLSRSNSVLDMGTGGGEVLASLAPFPTHAFAIEGYHPNFLIAKRRLEPLGVTVIEANETHTLPFKDNKFDLVLNRHSGINEKEVHRIMLSPGAFLTQQVSGDSMADLKAIFGATLQWPDSLLENVRKNLKEAGFYIERAEQWEGKMIFKDVGALVYYLKAIPWIVPDFSVDRFSTELKGLQKFIDEGKELRFSNKRYLVIATK